MLTGQEVSLDKLGALDRKPFVIKLALNVHSCTREETSFRDDFNAQNEKESN